MVLGLMVAACAANYPPPNASLDSPSSSVRIARSSAAMPKVNAPPAVAHSIPDINVKEVCQGIADQGSRTKEDCLDTEDKVRSQLVKVWASFDRADQIHCAIESQTGGESSYTELITCLEMAGDARKLREEANAPVHLSTVGQR